MKRFKFNAAQGFLLCRAKLTNANRSVFVKLVVDTGASLTMISVETALAMGIDPSKSVRSIEITTAGGIVIVPVIEVPSFKSFGSEAKGLEVVCHNLPLESPVDGLLGLNFLTKAKLTIDFSRNIIEVP